MLSGGYGEHWVFLLIRKYEALKKKQVFLNIDIINVRYKQNIIKE